MVKSICERCGNIMYDNEWSIRFKCNRCGQMFRKEKWLPQFREQINEAWPYQKKEDKK